VTPGLRRGRSWREHEYAVLDFETTGLDLRVDHVLSYGLVPVLGGRIRLAGAVYRVVRPPVEPSAASIRVHGIRPAELVGAPRLDDVVHELYAALRGRTLVAHVVAVELAFLGGLRRAHRGPRIRHAIDVHALATSLADRRTTAVPTNLAALAGSRRVPVGRTHHAFGDALSTAQLFLVLATELERNGQGSHGDLLRAGRSQFARSFAREPLDRTRPIA
jgi:DNA polymerase III subunit epsilon